MITDRLAGVLRRELGLPDFVFSEETRAHEVPGWDSLKHVELICAVETEYGVHFRSFEVLGVRNVGDLQRLVMAKRGPQPT